MSYPSLWERFLSPFKAAAIQQQEETCFWSVDMHSHLLPGLDDGVQESDQIVTCLTKLAEWGIQKVITTPHVSQDRYPNSTDSIRQGQKDLQTLLDNHQLPLKVEVAAEYMIDNLFFDLLEKDDFLAFGSERYLLIETGWAWAPNYLDNLLGRIQIQGYTPVLAHPERYRYFHDDRRSLMHLHKLGYLFQLNWMSLTGRYGAEPKRQAQYLLQEGVIDFIGSDLHHPDDLKDMNRLFTSSDWQLLTEQPILNNKLL
ncbi:capsular polysaccharide biosynthesis protein [Spirosoma harenae]